MSTLIGLYLITLGIAVHKGAKFYKKIVNRAYIDPFKQFPGGFYPQINRREALLILGVNDGSNIQLIKQRYKILMLNNHPDNDGSTYLAIKINQAKEQLLKL